MTELAETLDTLEALLVAHGRDHPTFQRMVGWYAEVADELGLRADYDRLVAGLVYSSVRIETSVAHPARQAQP